MSSTPKKVTLSIKDVDPAVRHLFNRACAVSDGSRGEIISQLMREFGYLTFGERANSIVEHYEEFNNNDHGPREL